MAQEQEQIHQQFLLILDEIQLLKKNYERWSLYVIQQLSSKDTDCIQSEELFGKEVESQRYFEERKRGSSRIDYQMISQKIASLLKENDTPMSTRQIYQKLIETTYFSLTFTNLSSNILRRMNEDRSSPVERAYRGYWQYRLKT